MDCYEVEPIRFLQFSKQKIPVFSKCNSYIENYLQISSDHLEGATIDSSNPFIPEEFLSESEKITYTIAKKHLKPDDKLLDVGCGSGRLLKKFDNVNRFGIDISAKYLEHLSGENITLCLSLIEDMPFKDNYFDMITCTDVLEHVLDLNGSLSNIARVLKPGGMLLIRVPYREDLSIYLREDYPYHFAHLRNFDENNIRLILEKVFMFNSVQVSFGPFICEPIYFKLPLLFRGGSFLARTVNRVLRLLPLNLSDGIKRWALNPVEMHILASK